MFAGEDGVLQDHSIFHLPQIKCAFLPQSGVILLLNTAKVVHGSLSCKEDINIDLWGSAMFCPRKIFSMMETVTNRNLELVGGLSDVLCSLPASQRATVKAAIVKTLT